MSETAIPRRAIVLLVILTLVWGTNWPLFAFAVREISVWTFRAVAVTLAGVALLSVARARGLSLVIPRVYWPTICTGTFFYLVIWNIASTYSAILIPSGQSAVLGFTMPLWSALISWAVLGERLPPRLLLAIALGAAADRTAQVGEGGRAGTAGQDELLEHRQVGIEFLGQCLEAGHLHFLDDFHARQAELAAKVEKVVLDVEQGGAHGIRQVLAKQYTEAGIKLIDFADGVDAQAILGCPAAVAEAGGAGIAGARDDPGQAIALAFFNGGAHCVLLLNMGGLY